MCCIRRIPLLFDRPVVLPPERYLLLQRLRRACDRHCVSLLAFRFEDERLIVVLEGVSTDVERALVGLRRGLANSSRRLDQPIRVVVGELQRVHDLEDTVIDLHAADGEDPLASPWTSHRDLLALRRAPFFDGDQLAERVEALAVHWAAGGTALPEGWPPRDRERPPLDLLLRVAAAVLGVLPADRRSFPIFVHLARRAGYRVRTIAEALTLTPRRVRQILGEDPEQLPAAITSLTDPRLLEVP